MNTEDRLRELLQEVIAISARPKGTLYGSGLWGKAHELAESHYQPAREFFIDKLDDPRWDWRRVCVSLLGFHYKIDHIVIDKLHEMLIHDPDSGVRIACASVLGIQSLFPDKTLLKALNTDPNTFVKKTAFMAILDLVGVPYKNRKIYNQKLRNGQIKPDLEQVKEILLQEKIIVDDKLFEVL